METYTAYLFVQNPLGHRQMDWIKFFQKIIIKSTLEGHGNAYTTRVVPKSDSESKAGFILAYRIYDCVENLESGLIATTWRTQM